VSIKAGKVSSANRISKTSFWVKTTLSNDWPSHSHKNSDINNNSSNNNNGNKNRAELNESISIRRDEKPTDHSIW
jgi:hypothetical protein